jgi:phage terminase large subunit-like protein
MDAWDACAFEIDMPMLKGRACYGGLDLSSTQDLTAFVLCFPPEDEEDKYIFLPFFWIPEDLIQEHVLKDHVQYDKWQAQGFLETTDGAVINYRYIEQKIKRLRDVNGYNIREIAFDRWGSHLLSQNLDDAGFRVAGFGQGYKSMSPPSQELITLVLEQRIAHGGHPVLRWCFDNVVMKSDEAGNIKPDKEKATQKIDGAVASIMALDRAIKREGRSVYENRGVLMLDRRGGYHYTC